MELASWPTPIKRLDGNGLTGVLVKRDDLCGHGRGGVKARKVEHLVGHIVAGGYDEVITVVGNVTNVVFDLVAPLRSQGITMRFLVQDDPPVPAAVREGLFEGVREHVEFLGPRASAALGLALLRFAQSRLAGRRPFLLLPSISHPAAVVGNACGFVEMAEQLLERGQPLPGTVFITVASGATLAGFLIGEHALRRAGHPPIRVLGVQVYPGAVRRWTWWLVRWTERFLGLENPVPAERIEIDTSALHGGFCRYPEEIRELCERVKAQMNLCIDPIFGGKTWSIMERYQKEHPASGRPVLYWHCGYAREWQTLRGASQANGGT